MFKCVEFDGGGIRGIYSANIFSYLPKIDYDLYVGTSAGAINAALLACGYSTLDIIHFYIDDKYGKKIFKKYILPSFPFKKSKYDSGNIDSVLDSVFGNKKLGDLNKKILIPAYDIRSRNVIKFNNITDEFNDLYLKDIVRASSAAPYYFTPHEFNEFRCIDGGLAANNGSMLAYSLIRDKYNISKDDILMISIGTGSFENELKSSDMELSKPINLLSNLIDCFMDANADTVEMEAMELMPNYFRFQGKIPEKNSSLDNTDISNLEQLLTLSDNLMSNICQDKINLIKNIIERKE